MLVLAARLQENGGLLTKKETCAKYQDEAAQQADRKDHGTSAVFYVHRVFYSRTRDSCLYAISGFYDISTFDGDEIVEVDFENWAEIHDALTGELVWQFSVQTSALEDDDNFRQAILDKLNRELSRLE